MAAPAGICVLGGKDFVFELVNPAYQAILPNRELLNRPLFEALPELRGQPLQKLLENVYETGASERVLEQMIPVAEFDGGPLIERYFNFNYQARLDTDGKIDGILVFVYEVTEIVFAKNQLTANADFLQSQLNAIPEIAWTNTIDGEVDFYNQKWFDYTGLNFAETKAWGWKDVIHPDDLDFNLASYRSILQGTTGGQFEVREKSVDGEFRWHVVRMMPIKNKNGTIHKWIGTATDIHELKETNEKLASAREQLEITIDALSASEANLSGIILQAPVAMGLFLGQEMKLEIINDKFLELWDKDKTVLGKTLHEALPELIGQPYQQIMLEVYHTGEPYFGNEAKVELYRQGKLKPGYFNFINQPFINKEGNIIGIIVVANEVTDQVNARNELERVYEQVRLSKEAAQLGTFDMDLVLGTMEWDERCRTLFGISHHNKVTYEDDFLPGLHPEDKERIIKIINDVFVKAKSNGVYDVEYRTIGVEDQKLRWVRAKGQAYFNEEDVPIRFIGSVLDITEQKNDELRKNDFIGMVSHELKTPLTSLTALIQMLNLKLKTNADAFIPSALGKANLQVKKMSNMINGFLNVSRLESGKMILAKTEFDLEKLIKEIIDETELIISSQILKFEPCNPVPVIADYDKIGSVLTNLISNAIKYSPKNEEITVKCQVVESKAVVSVKDKGIGIKPKDKEKLFERYYRVQTSHTQHISGFGIGLYLSAEIIERHNGKIWVESEPDKGSTFYFELPLQAL